MESYSVQAVLSAVDSGFSAQMRAAQGSLQELGKESGNAKTSILDIAKGVGAFKLVEMGASAARASLDKAFGRIDTMAQFDRTITRMTGSSDDAKNALDRLSNATTGTAYGLDVAAKATQDFVTRGMHIGDATRSVEGWADAVAFYGKGTNEQLATVTDAIGKMRTKGTVEMDQLNRLFDVGIDAVGMYAKAVGRDSASVQQDLTDKVITTEEFVKVVEKAMREGTNGVMQVTGAAKDAGASWAGTFDNMKAATARGMVGIIQSIDNGLTKGALPDMRTGLMAGAKSFEKLLKAAGSVTSHLLTAAGPALKLIVDNMDVVGATAVTATAGFVAFKAALAIQNTATKATATIKTYKMTVEATNKALKLGAQAEELNAKAKKVAASASSAIDKALRTESVAESINARAKEASKKAAKAKTDAQKAEKASVQAASAATKAGNTNEALNATAKQLSTKATKTKTEAEKLELRATELNNKAKNVAAKASGYKTTATAAEAAATAVQEKATIAETAATATSTASISIKTIAIGLLTKQITLAEAATMLWNKAMSANPIGAVIALVAALAGTLVAVNKAMIKNDKKLQEVKKTTEKTSEATKTLSTEISASAEAYEANARSIDTEAEAAKSLVGKLEELAGKEDKSKKDKQMIQQYVDSLNNSVADLNLSYDEELDMLNMTEDAMYKKIDAFKAQAEAQASEEYYIELLKKQKEVAAELKTVDEGLVAATKKYNEAGKWQTTIQYEAAKSAKELAGSKQELKEKEEELNVAIKDQEEAMDKSTKKAADSSVAASDAVSEGVEKQIKSLDDLDDKQQEVVESLTEKWSSYVDAATNMFDVLSDKSELSVADMTNNLIENQRVISEWADNIAKLAERGIDEGLLEQLRQAGPAGAGHVKALVEASDEELTGLSTAFANGGTTATDAFKNAFNISEMGEDVQSLIFKTKESMQTAITEADFGSIGKAVPDGYSKGIVDNAEDALWAATHMVEGGIEAAATAQDSHSPSVVYEGLGGDAVDGYILGVQNKQASAEAALKSVIEKGIQAATQTANVAMSSLATNTNKVLTAIANAAKTSISTMAIAVSTGMSTVNKTIDISMKQSERTVKTSMSGMTKDVKSGMSEQSKQITDGYNQINVSATSGMERFVDTVSTGMSSALNDVQNGKTDMITTIEGLETGFYNAGLMSAYGLANGISDGAGTAISAAQRLADQIAETMRNALDIHSPSRVTTQIGEYAGEGPAIGLLNMLPTVAKASEKLAEVMIPDANLSRLSTGAGRYDFKMQYDVSTAKNNVIDYDRFGEAIKEAVKEIKLEVKAIISAKDTGNATTKYIDRNMNQKAILEERYV